MFKTSVDRVTPLIQLYTWRECASQRALFNVKQLINAQFLYSGQIHEHTQEQEDGDLRERKSVVTGGVLRRFVGGGFSNEV